MSDRPSRAGVVGPGCIPLPLLALPVAAWALTHSAKLARERGAASWVRAVLALVGVGYTGWIAYLIAHGLGLI